MTNTAKIALGVVGAGAVVVVLLLILRPNTLVGPTKAGDADSALVLGQATPTSPCTVTTSSGDKNVEVAKNGKVTWHVTNNCDAPQVVVIGNFRETQPSTVDNCNAGVVETVWPFKANEDQSVKYIYVSGKGGTADLTLKDAKNDTGSKKTYYFDVCFGGKKADPELVIDP